MAFGRHVAIVVRTTFSRRIRPRVVLPVRVVRRGVISFSGFTAPRGTPVRIHAPYVRPDCSLAAVTWETIKDALVGTRQGVWSTLENSASTGRYILSGVRALSTSRRVLPADSPCKAEFSRLCAGAWSSLQASCTWSHKLTQHECRERTRIVAMGGPLLRRPGWWAITPNRRLRGLGIRKSTWRNDSRRCRNPRTSLPLGNCGRWPVPGTFPRCLSIFSGQSTRPDTLLRMPLPRVPVSSMPKQLVTLTSISRRPGTKGSAISCFLRKVPRYKPHATVSQETARSLTLYPSRVPN